MSLRARWSRWSGVVLATALAVVPVSAPGTAAAAPSDQPGGTSSGLDSAALDELQDRFCVCMK